MRNAIYPFITTSVVVAIGCHCKIFTFTYTINCNRGCDFYLLLVLAPGLFYYLMNKNKRSLAFAIKLAVLSLFFILLLVSDQYSFVNEHFYFLGLAFIFFIVFTDQNDRIQRSTLIVLSLLFFYEIVLGIGQLISPGGWKTGNSYLLHGSMINSGVYACLIALLAPLVVYHISAMHIWRRFRAQRNTVLTSITWLIVSCAAVFAASTRSRTALISVGILIAYFLSGSGWRFSAFKQQLTKPLIKLFAIVTTVLIAGSLCLFKINSASGRIMQWEIVRHHIFESFLTGVGIGRFTWYYPQWQADYFYQNQLSSNYFRQLADESFLVNNEFIQIFKESGLGGFILFAGICTYLLRCKNVRCRRLSSAARITVLILLINGLTLYVFHVTLMLVIFAIAAAILHSCTSKPTDSRSQYKATGRPYLYLRLLCLAFYGGVLIAGFLQHKAIFEWEDLKDRDDLTVQQRALEYSRLSGTLARDGKFQTEYGEFLMQKLNDFPLAAKAYRNARHNFLSYRLLEDEAENFKLMKNYDAAKNNYLFLNNYIPCRFSPLYEILHIDLEQNDFDNALQKADLIIKMPVKVPSPEVDFIKEDAAAIKQTLIKRRHNANHLFMPNSTISEVR